MGTITVSKTIRTPWNTSGYSDIVRGVLGDHYTLSIVCIGDKRACTLHKRFKNKNTPTNILSFPLGNNVAEIFLNVPMIKRDARKFDFTAANFGKYLLIHGCLHLKGYSHGSTMEEAEESFIKKYKLR